MNYCEICDRESLDLTICSGECKGGSGKHGRRVCETCARVVNGIAFCADCYPEAVRYDAEERISAA